MKQPLSLRKEGAVARLRLERPEVHNAFDAALVAALTHALSGLALDASVRVLVLEGDGPSFSAGADLHWMRGMAAASELDNRQDALALAKLLRTLDELPKPTIARVHGAAFGGGVGLVAACDIAIGVPEAKFGLTESRLGLLPAVISPYVVNAIGPRQARRYFASAEIFDAAQAQRMGLLHEVVEPDALDAAVQPQVDLLLKAGPVASASAKQLVRAVCAHADGAKHDADNAALNAATRRQAELLLKAGPIAAASAKALVRNVAAASGPVAIDTANAELIARLRVSPEGQEGINAFLEKRKPSWVK